MSDQYITGANWRHVASGQVYYITGFVTREEDMALLVTYRSTSLTGGPEVVWCRPASEFFDGRFVRLFPGVKFEE